MTKRYFYTDPLSAAWMQKHFGMHFILHLEDFTEIGINFIHPYSLSILEPQVGDLCTYEHYSVQLSSYGGSWEDNCLIIWPPSPYGGCGYHANDKNCRNLKIRLRNGIVFMWPECEEV